MTITQHPHTTHEERPGSDQESTTATDEGPASRRPRRWPIRLAGSAVAAAAVIAAIAFAAGDEALPTAPVDTERDASVFVTSSGLEAAIQEQVDAMARGSRAATPAGVQFE